MGWFKTVASEPSPVFHGCEERVSVTPYQERDGALGFCPFFAQLVWRRHRLFVDLFDHGLGLVIEAESYQWHSSRTALARDVRRYTWCARLGYTVVRFTWEEVMFHPEYVRAVLMDLVALGPRTRAVGRRTA